MYTLHTMSDSASSIVEMVLQELGLPYETKPVARADLSSPAHRALHPLGLVPVLLTPHGTVFETAAILLHLTETTGKLAPAPGTPDRATFLTWLFFTSTNLHTTLLQTFYPDRTAGPENTGPVVAHARAKLHIHLNLLENLAAYNPGYLSHTQPTALGYYIAVLMRWIAADFPPANYPSLHRVLAYLETRPATQTIAQAEGLGPHPFTQP